MKLLLTALLFFVTACGPGVEEGPAYSQSVDTEYAMVDTNHLNYNTDDSETDTNIEVCPGEINDSCNFSEGYRYPASILEGAWFNPPITFKAFDIDTIAGTRIINGKQVPVVISWNFDESPSGSDSINLASYGVLPLEDEVAEPLGVVSSIEYITKTNFRKIALFKKDNTYLFYGVNEALSGQSSVMTKIETATLTTERKFTKIIYLQNRSILNDPSLDKLCLLGDGITCFDGTQFSDLYTDDSSYINDIGIMNENEKPVLIAVGSNGFIGFNRDNSWDLSLSNLTKESLNSISVHPEENRFTSGGNNGVVVNSDLDKKSPIVCNMGIDNILTINYFTTFEYFNTLTANGAVYGGSLNTWRDGYFCDINFDIYENPISARPVGSNYFVLSPTTLYGGQMRIIAID
ncbi:MAG: hypothetical protein JXR91_16570 [Deltaproteobacteria bacterium]|nr:hypothetical protein [Deltaproteobacteria bacterium]